MDENVQACIFYNFSLKKFCRTFNYGLYQWCKIYLYLNYFGGKKYKKINIFLIFLFIGISFGLELKYLFWSLLLSLGYLIEIILKDFSEKKKFSPLIFSFISAFSYLFIFMANLTGFSVGIEGFIEFYERISPLSNFLIFFLKIYKK